MKANVIKSLPIFTLYESLSYHCLIIMSNTTTSTTTQNVKARWAQRLVREKLSVEINALQENGVTLAALPDVGHPQWTHDNLPKDPKYKDGKRRVGGDNTPPRKVCIVGAGIAGLYIAMILDSLKVPNLTYDILEANSRVGGRIYTYHVSIANGGCVPDDVVDNVGDILEQTFGPYKDKLAENFEEGFDELMKVDHFSTREYLKSGGPDGEQRHYDYFSIQWMETMNTSTNLFDQAFSESVLDSFDFDYPKEHRWCSKEPNWCCIEGGTSLLSDAMHKMLNTRVETNKRVERISINRKSNVDGNMLVKCFDETAARPGYSTVFATPALGCLARMDLRTLELHPSQKDAIRSLHYDDSVKVALQFSYPWWIVDCYITEGGVASTDLPLRTCVYPSYNLKDGSDKPAVLLATYTWAQDANRMGSLINPQHSTNDEEELVELILQNLAQLHAKHTTYERIKTSFTGIYDAYSWSHDPTTVGAFALFGPGQFTNLYPFLSRPMAESKFHIVGEAASAHHAWLVGALDSAYTAVYKFLRRFELWDAIEALQEEWGEVEELETGEHGTVHLQVMFGMLRKEQHVRV